MSQYARYFSLGGSGGVTSVNSLTGAVTLAAGSNITITPSGNTLTIASTGGGANVALSNLASVAINTSLLPGVTRSIDVGSPSFQMRSGYFSSTVTGLNAYFPAYNIVDNTFDGSSPGNTNSVGELDGNDNGGTAAAPNADISLYTYNIANQPTYSPNVANQLGIRITTADSAYSGAASTFGPTQDIEIRTGIAALAAQDSGNITLLTGTATGSRGTIKLQNGSEGTAGQVWVSTDNAGSGSWQNLSGSSAFAAYASTQVTTTSTGITSGSFTTFSNSPAFTFTPTITGTYKVYCSIPLELSTANAQGVARIIKTSGSGTLLQESQGFLEFNGGTYTGNTAYIQSTYTLTAGVTYVFDIQGLVVSGLGTIDNVGSVSPFYMFAEGIALANNGQWTSYTPTFTGMGTVSTQTFWYKVDNDSIFIKGRWTTGTTTATIAKISLPAGYTTNASKVNGTSELCGYLASSDNDSNALTVVIQPSSTVVNFGFNTDSGGGLTPVNGNTVFNNGIDYSFSTTGIPVA